MSEDAPLYCVDIPGCAFCGVVPGRIAWSSPLATALWDAFPVLSGHALVVPRHRRRSIGRSSARRRPRHPEPQGTTSRRTRERKLEGHDAAITAILSAIREVMNPPEAKRRGIGFTADVEPTR